MNGFGYKELNQQTKQYRGSGGISSECQDIGFAPAFKDMDDGKIYLSRHADGHQCSVHILDGLPDSLVKQRDEYGNVCQVKESIISGFMRNGMFFTRSEAAIVVCDL